MAWFLGTIPHLIQEKMSLIDTIIDDLLEKNYSIQQSILTEEIIQQLYEEGLACWESGEFRTARIGKGDEEQKRPEIRSDKIHWLDPEKLSSNQNIYWNFIDELRNEVNRTFFFGLKDFEAHFAVYPEGAFYKKHLDQFTKTPHRFVSCILYLNKDWKPEQGGQLRIYKDGENEMDFLDIQPEFGKFVCFLSGNLYHEVLPAKRERFSLTGWLRKESIPFIR
jgi:SM-20-related protein